MNEVSDLSPRDSPSHAAETLAVKLSLGLQPAERKDTKGVDRCSEHSKNMLNVHGKSASLAVRLVRFKALVIGSVLVIGALLSVAMSLE